MTVLSCIIFGFLAFIMFTMLLVIISKVNNDDNDKKGGTDNDRKPNEN